MRVSRWSKPKENKEYQSEYDIKTCDIQDLIQRQPAPLSTRTLSLVGAGTLSIAESGYGFSFYTYSAAGAIIQGYTDVAIQQNTPINTFPCHTGRGYVGAFTQLFLSWPDHSSLDSGAIGYFLIFKSQNYPWAR